MLFLVTLKIELLETLLNCYECFCMTLSFACPVLDVSKTKFLKSTSQVVSNDFDFKISGEMFLF